MLDSPNYTQVSHKGFLFTINPTNLASYFSMYRKNLYHIPKVEVIKISPAQAILDGF